MFSYLTIALGEHLYIKRRYYLTYRQRTNKKAYSRELSRQLEFQEVIQRCFRLIDVLGDNIISRMDVAHLVNAGMNKVINTQKSWVSALMNSCLSTPITN